jgi:hypothetical protein
MKLYRNLRPLRNSSGALAPAIFKIFTPGEQQTIISSKFFMSKVFNGLKSVPPRSKN